MTRKDTLVTSDVELSIFDSPAAYNPDDNERLVNEGSDSGVYCSKSAGKAVEFHDDDESADTSSNHATKPQHDYDARVKQGYLGLLQVRPYLVLLGADIVSLTGDWLNYIGTVVVLQEKITDSSTALRYGYCHSLTMPPPSASLLGFGACCQWLHASLPIGSHIIDGGGVLVVVCCLLACFLRCCYRR
jgi:hypothetical protein